jgi:hypothetical protein
LLTSALAYFAPNYFFSKSVGFMIPLKKGERERGEREERNQHFNVVKKGHVKS